MKYATIITLISFGGGCSGHLPYLTTAFLMQQMSSQDTASREALSGTWRQSLTLKTSEFWSQNQQMQLADDNPFIKQTVYGQTRTSVTSLAEHTYWQQQRDKRKSSQLQKIPLDPSGLPQTGLSQSTGADNQSAGFQRHKPTRNSLANGYSSIGGQHTFSEGTIPALRMPAGLNGSSTTSWDERGTEQTDHEAHDAGSRYRNSRHGSSVRFAAEESARHPSFGQRANDRQVRPSAQSLYSTMRCGHLCGIVYSILPAFCMQSHRLQPGADQGHPAQLMFVFVTIVSNTCICSSRVHQARLALCTGFQIPWKPRSCDSIRAAN